MYERCTNCGLPPDPAVKPAMETDVMSQGPWPARYQIGTRRCLQCGSTNRFCEGPGGFHAWSTRFEKLKQGRDYDVIGSRDPFIGPMPLTVVWVWHPLMSSPQADGSIMALLGKIQALSKYIEDVLVIYPHGMKANAWDNRFAQVWQLRGHVTDDASGPYPSIKAEKSLIATFAELDLRRIIHVWPAVTLDPQWYCPIGSDDEIKKLWAQTSRQRVPVQIQEK